MNTTTLTTLPTTQKINNILSLQQITLTDIQHLNPPEREQLGKAATKMLAQLTGEERDNFLAKIEAIIPADAKNSFWEHNHTVISRAISNYMSEYGRMPNKSAIAEETGFSRQTIAKHFAAYQSHPEFAAQMEQFKFMANDVLAKVFKQAGNGDMRAARLYFEMVGVLNKPQPNTVVSAQNNYIQINNTILNQETVKQLTAEQLNQIENIVKREDKLMLNV